MAEMQINSLTASSYNVSLKSTDTGDWLRSLCVVGCGAYELDEIKNKATLSQERLQLGLHELGNYNNF